MKELAPLAAFALPLALTVAAAAERQVITHTTDRVVGCVFSV